MSDSQSRKQLAKKLSKNLGMATPLVVAAFGMAQVATAQSSNCPPGSTYTQGICLVTSAPRVVSTPTYRPAAEAGSAHKASGEAEAGSAHKASGEAEAGSAHKASGEAEAGSAHKATGEAEAGSAHKATGEAEAGSAYKAKGEAEGSAHKAKGEAEGSAYKK